MYCGGCTTYVKDFGALVAATWSNTNEDTNLELATNELGQLRIMVADDIRVRLHNPTPVSKWRTTKTNFWLPQFPPGPDNDWLRQYYFKVSEFFYWGRDNKPAFDLYSVLAAATSRIAFTGYKFKMEKITTAGAFVLQVDSWPGIR